MAEIAAETRLGVFNINNTVPKLNHIYDGRIYNVQVFAGLIGGAAVVAPVDVNFINYGLSRGSNKICLEILKRLYPDKNITVVTGEDAKGNPVMDQISIIGNTNIAQVINEEASFYKISPQDFGFKFGNIKNIQSKKTKRENTQEFIKLLLGKSNQDLESLIAMETAINLCGVQAMDNLKQGASLALEVIKSGKGIQLLEKLVNLSGGNVNNLRKISNSK